MTADLKNSISENIEVAIRTVVVYFSEPALFKVQIKENSQMGKVIGYAQYKLRHPRNRTIIVVGRGVAKTKVLNCVQILLSKNKVKDYG